MATAAVRLSSPVRTERKRKKKAANKRKEKRTSEGTNKGSSDHRNHQPVTQGTKRKAPSPERTYNYVDTTGIDDEIVDEWLRSLPDAPDDQELIRQVLARAKELGAI